VKASKFDSFADAAASAGKAEKRPGRAKATRRAKRDDPDYKQALAYVRRDTHRRVMSKLAETEKEFSDLVEELLSDWLKKNS
jgi:hypothetical protein